MSCKGILDQSNGIISSWSTWRVYNEFTWDQPFGQGSPPKNKFGSPPKNNKGCELKKKKNNSSHMSAFTNQK